MSSITKKRNKSKRNKTSKNNITQRKKRNMRSTPASVNKNKQKHINHMNVDNKKEKNSVNSNLILSNLEKKKKGTLKNINYRYFNQKYYYQ
jgi:hypothetical protein